MTAGRRALPPDEALAAALARHQQGRLAEAEAAYQALLQAHPGHAGALHLLGLAHFQRGDAAAAARLIGESLARDGRNAVAHNNHGAVLLALGRLEEALAAFERACALKPDYAEALNNAGNALVSLGRPAEALDRYRRALELGLRSATLHVNRGIALQGLGRPDEALAAFDEALAMAPDSPDALANRGEALRRLGRYREALESLDRALALAPAHPQAHNNRGAVLFQAGSPGEALESYRRAVRARPGFGDALANQAQALVALGRHDEAIACCDQAIGLDPGRARPHWQRALALLGARRPEDALPGVERALALDPDLPYAPGMRLYLRMLLCEWEGFEADCARLVAGVLAGRKVAQPLALIGIPAPAQAQLACARTFSRDLHPGEEAVTRAGAPGGDGRIRVAYLSADFRDHPVAHLVAELLERHDRARFEVTAVSLGPPSDDPWRRRIEEGVDRFVDGAALADARVAGLVRELGTDIAVDLTGYTAGARTGILARRCAPVQVNFLGFPGTMGADFIDYLVADSTVVPPGHEAFYAEKVVHLPHCYLPNDSTKRVSERAFRRAELGLPEDGTVFCCFNSSAKITPGAFAAWMRLLRQVPGSVLWLRGAAPAARANLRRHAREAGVAQERLVFAEKMDDLSEHLARHRAADLFLDTFPYNAHTTASDALWAGLPVVTWLGETFASRAAASQLHALGLPELVARTADEYEALALALATDRERLAAVRARLDSRRRESPFFDAGLFARHLEAAFAAMHERRCRGLAPAPIGVPA